MTTGIALAVFPLYLWGGRSNGVSGLALASVAAISLNALVTVAWLRARTGSPDLAALAQTALRTFAIAALAAGAATALLYGLAPANWSPLGTLFAGGAAYGFAMLVGVRLLGDAPLRAGIDRVAQGFSRRMGRKRPS